MNQVAPPRAYDEVVAFFASGPTRDAIAAFRLSDETVARVRQLLVKKSAGTLTADEADELDECVQLDRIVLLIRSQAYQQMQSVASLSLYSAYTSKSALSVVETL